MTDNPSAAERARKVIAKRLDWSSNALLAADDAVTTLLADPSLLAALAVEAGGMEHIGAVRAQPRPGREGMGDGSQAG